MKLPKPKILVQWQNEWGGVVNTYRVVKCWHEHDGQAIANVVLEMKLDPDAMGNDKWGNISEQLTTWRQYFIGLFGGTFGEQPNPFE